MKLRLLFSSFSFYFLMLAAMSLLSCEKAERVSLLSDRTWVVVDDNFPVDVMGDTYRFLDNRLFFRVQATSALESDGSWDLEEGQLDVLLIETDLTSERYFIQELSSDRLTLRIDGTSFTMRLEPR